MHPGNNFIISLVVHRWGMILFMLIIFGALLIMKFNIIVVLGSLVIILGALFMTLLDDQGGQRRYTNLLMVFSIMFYGIIIIFNLLTYNRFKNKYTDVNTTGYVMFYEDKDKSNNIYFVKPGTREVFLSMPFTDDKVKSFLAGTNPKLVKHTTNSKWFQYDDVDYDIRFPEQDIK